MTEREAAHEAVRGIWKAAAGLPKDSPLRAWLMGLRKDIQQHIEVLPPERPSRLRRVVLPLAFAATASTLVLSLVNSTSPVVGEPARSDLSAITQSLAQVEAAQDKIQRQHKRIMAAARPQRREAAPGPSPQPAPSPTPAPAPPSSPEAAGPSPRATTPVVTEPQHPGNGPPAHANAQGPPPGKGWRK